MIALTSVFAGFKVGTTVFPINSLILDIRPDGVYVGLNYSRGSGTYGNVYVQPTHYENYTLDGVLATGSAEIQDFYSQYMCSVVSESMSVGQAVVGAEANALMRVDNQGNMIADSNVWYDLGGAIYVNEIALLDVNDVALVAFTGDALNLTNLAPVAITNSYDQLNDKPTISSVGQTGEYSDILNPPSIPEYYSFLASGNGTNTFTFSGASDLTSCKSIICNTPTSIGGAIISVTHLGGGVFQVKVGGTTVNGLSNITGYYVGS